MPRPCKRRRVAFEHGVNFFKPHGVPLSRLEIVEIRKDELEAIRLADIEKLYHADAAEKMEVSRQTFGNILSAARTQIADAIINCKAVLISEAEDIIKS